MCSCNRNMIVKKILVLLALCATDCTGVKNLYDVPDCRVKELDGNGLKSLVEHGTKTVVVFYAPWCGHCQRFAPSFMKLAAASASQYGDSVLFGAVNCVAHRDTCQTYEINSYPTIRVVGYSQAVEKSVKDKDMHNIGHIEAFLQKEMQLSAGGGIKGEGSNLRGRTGQSALGALDSVHNLDLDTPGEATEGEGSSTDHEAEKMAWRQRTTSGPARVAAAEDRLHDALVSLRFLVQMEAMAQKIDTEKKHRVMAFLRVLVYLLPKGWGEGFVRFSQTLRRVHSVQDVDEAADAAFGDSLRTWRVCGVDKADLTSLDSAATTKALFDGSHGGYTCGLWLLFHYLTVSAEQVAQAEAVSLQSANPLIDTAQVMSLIRFAVAELFNCRHCRTHFLDTFDSCKLERCKVAKDDYVSLQDWLWRVHNDVTLRILNFHLPIRPGDGDGASAENYSWTEGVRVIQAETRWPAPSECEPCVAQFEANHPSGRDRIHAYLRQQYWSSEWEVNESNSSSRAKVVTAVALFTRDEPVNSRVYLRPEAVSLVANQEAVAWAASSTFGKAWFLHFVLIFGVLATVIAIYIVAFKQSKISNLVNKRAY